MNNTTQPFQYREIQDIHERFKQVNPAFQGMSLPQFSDYLTKETGESAFEAGKKDNIFMRTSAGLDRLLEKTGAPQLSRKVGSGIGSMFGMEKPVGDVFETFPRMGITLAPLIAAEILSGGLATVPIAAGMAGSAGLAGLDAYEKSGGDTTSAAIAAGTFPIMAGASKIAGNAALRKMGAPLVEKMFGEPTLTAVTTGQKLARAAAGNAAAFGVQEGAVQAQSLAHGQGFVNPLEPEHLVTSLTGFLPFFGLEAATLMAPNKKLPTRRPAQAQANAAEIDTKLIGQEHIKRSTDDPGLPDINPKVNFFVSPDGEIYVNTNREAPLKTEDPTRPASWELDPNSKTDFFVSPDGEVHQSPTRKPIKKTTEIPLEAEMQKPLELLDRTEVPKAPVEPGILDVPALIASMEAETKTKVDLQRFSDLYSLRFHLERKVMDALKQGADVFTVNAEGEGVRLSMDQKGRIVDPSGKKFSANDVLFSETHKIQIGGEVPPVEAPMVNPAKAQSAFAFSEAIKNVNSAKSAPEALMRYMEAAEALDPEIANPTILNKLKKVTKAFIGADENSTLFGGHVKAEEIVRRAFNAAASELNQFDPLMRAAKETASFSNRPFAKLAIQELSPELKAIGDQAVAEMNRNSPQPIPAEVAYTEIYSQMRRGITPENLDLSQDKLLARLSVSESLEAAMELLPKEYLDFAADFVKKNTFDPSEARREHDPTTGELLSEHETNLRAEEAQLTKQIEKAKDPHIKEALVQELEYIRKPVDDAYNRELSMLLEDSPEFQSMNALKGKKIVRSDRDISDHTERVYETVLAKYTQGVPVDQIKLDPRLLSAPRSGRRHGDMPSTTVQPHVFVPETGAWVPATHFESREAAQTFLAHHQASLGPEPGVRYTVKDATTQPDGTPGAPVRIIRTENALQRLIEGYEAGGDSTNNPFKNISTERDSFGDMDYTEFYQNLQGKETSAPVESTNRRSTFLAQALESRIRALLERMPNSTFGKAYQHRGVERLAILLELEKQSPDGKLPFSIKRNGSIGSVDTQMVQKAWAEAGLELSSTSALTTSKAEMGKAERRLVERTVKHLVETANETFRRDPILRRINRDMDFMLDWARQADGMETPEFYAARKVAEAAHSQLGYLRKNVGIKIVQSLNQLKKLDPAAYDEAVKRGGVPEAVYNRNNQTITIIAENVSQRPGETTLQDSVTRLIWHEGAGHFGLEDMFGSKFNHILEQTYKLVPEYEKQSIAVMYKAPITDKLFIASEWLAQRSEMGIKLPLFDTLISGMKQFLLKSNARFNFGVMTDADILYMIKKNRDRLATKRGFAKVKYSQDGAVGPYEPQPEGNMPLSQGYLFSLAKNDSWLKDATTFVKDLGVRKGLPIEEADRHSQNTFAALKERVPMEFFRISEHYVYFNSELGAASFRHHKSPSQTRANGQQLVSMHKAFQRAIETADPESPITHAMHRFSEWVRTSSPEDKDSLNAGLKRLYGDMEFSPNISKPSDMAAHIANLVTARGSEALKEFFHAPEPVASLARGLIKDVTAMADSVMSILEAENAKLLRSKIVGKAQETAWTRIHDLLPLVTEDVVEGKRIANEMMQLENFKPDAVLDALAGAQDGPGVLGKLGRFAMSLGGYKEIPKEFPKGPNIFERIYDLPSNLAQKHPEFRNFLKMGVAYQAVANNAIAALVEPLGFQAKGSWMRKTPVFKEIHKAASDPLVSGAYSLLASKQQAKVEKMTTDHLKSPGSVTPGSGRLTPSELAILRKTHPTLSPLSDSQFQLATLLLEKTSDVTKKAAGLIQKGVASSLTNIYRTILGRELNWNHLSEIDGVVRMLGEYLETGDPNALTQFRSQNISPARLAEIMGTIDTEFRPNFQRFQQLLAVRDGYLSETRPGKFIVVYRDVQGNKRSQGFETQAEVLEFNKELQGDPNVNKASIKMLDKEASRQEDKVFNPLMLRQVQDMEQMAMEKLRDVVGDAVFEADIKPNYVPLEASIREARERKLQDFMKGRQRVGGFEELDYLKGVLSYVHSVAYGSAHAYVKRTGDFLLEDARLQYNPAMHKLAKDYTNNLLRPTTKAERVIKETAFQYFMALNISTMAFEMLQSAVTLAPWLTKHGSGWRGSYAEIARAGKTLAEAGRKKRFSDPVLETYSNRALDEGLFSRVIFHDIDDPAGVLTSVHDSISGVPSKARRWGKAYVNFTRNLYGLASHTNSRLAFIAGYHRGKEMGLSGEALYAFATETVQATMFIGGKGNRPIGLYSGSEQSQPLRAMHGALGSYLFGMVGTFDTYIRKSMSKAGTAAERSANRRALAQLTATQLFLAGGLGMPGAAAALAVMEQMFPGLEAKKNIEEIPKAVLGDTGFGNWLVDSLLYGVPTSSTPFDVSSRLGLEQVMGVSTMEGLDTSTLFGPFGSMGIGGMKAIQEAQSGEFTRALEKTSPIFIRNLIRALKNEGEVRDYSGNMLAKMDGWDRMLTGLGFRPKAISDLQQDISSQRRLANIEKKYASKFLQKQGRALLQGDVIGVRQAILDQAMQDETIDPRQLGRQISRKAVDMSMPFEVGRGINVKSADRIASVLGPQAPRTTTELQRLMQQIQFEQTLQIPGLGVPTQQQLLTASQIDQIIDQNPTLTTDQAKLILRRQKAAQSPFLPFQ